MKYFIRYWSVTVYSSLFFILTWPDTSHCAFSGTPNSLQDIFIGRCHEYQDVIYPEPFLANPKNCSYLYELFYEAFSFKDPCDVSVSNYYKFVAEAEHEMETKDRVMYWSGSVYPLVYEYTASMRRYVTIRDTLSGYVIVNIDAWCGQTTDPGVNTTECPPWGQCINQSTPTYWQAISEDFARRVEGHIHVLLNGSSGSAYIHNSTFSQYELANLEASRNPAITVLLIHNIDPPAKFRETCANGSLVTLKNEVQQKQISYNCIDDPMYDKLYYFNSANHPQQLLFYGFYSPIPGELLHFQCTDYVNATVCQHMGVNGAVISGQLTSQQLLYTLTLYFLAFSTLQL